MRSLPLLLLLVASPAMSQAPAPAVSGGISNLEARNTLQNTLAAVERTLGLSPEKSSSLATSAPMTRGETIAQFHRFFKRFESEFELEPIPIRLDPQVNFGGLSETGKSQLRELLSVGALPAVGTLATVNRAPSSEEFGIELAILVMRVLELSHRPDPQFSPYLSPEN